jgi:hypothetical protein
VGSTGAPNLNVQALGGAAGAVNDPRLSIQAPGSQDSGVGSASQEARIGLLTPEVTPEPELGAQCVQGPTGRGAVPNETVEHQQGILSGPGLSVLGNSSSGTKPEANLGTRSEEVAIEPETMDTELPNSDREPYNSGSERRVRASRPMVVIPPYTPPKGDPSSSERAQKEPLAAPQKRKYVKKQWNKKRTSIRGHRKDPDD